MRARAARSEVAWIKRSGIQDAGGRDSPDFLRATTLRNAEWGMRNAEFRSLPSSVGAQPSASKLHPPSLQPSDSRPQTLDSGLVLRLQLVGANPNPHIAGLEELPGKVNYLLGNDAPKWHTNVPTYAKAKYKAEYQG